MSKQVPFYITSGLPFEKQVIVTLPVGRDWWTNISQFEVLSQARDGVDQLAPLIVDLAQHMDVIFTAPNTVTIDLFMTGAQTRLVTKSGNYDIIISNPLPSDERAIKVLDGPVYRTSLVTSDTGIV